MLRHEEDRRHLNRAVELALAAEASGNLPIGAVIALDGRIVGEGGNGIHAPAFHPGRHAEIQALRAVPSESWSRASELTCYTTLEPCLMCYGALVLHGVGRVFFGAHDPLGGAISIVDCLPAYVREKARSIAWIGPALPEVCDPLAARAIERFRT